VRGAIVLVVDHNNMTSPCVVDRILLLVAERPAVPNGEIIVVVVVVVVVVFVVVLD